jgi:hypothetical protein
LTNLAYGSSVSTTRPLPNRLWYFVQTWVDPSGLIVRMMCDALYRHAARRKQPERAERIAMRAIILTIVIRMPGR